MTSKNNIILTGVPRSGTTLTCHLLNKVPDTVALHEPMNVREFGRVQDRDRINELVRSFFDASRRSLLENRTAVSKHRAGEVPDNPISGSYAASGLRESIISRSTITLDKELAPDFHLVIKHPSAFTAALGSLVRNFPCYAIVRNPLSVLSSWISVALPVQQGRIPAAEQIDADLKSALGKMDDVSDRQFHLLDWFFRQYRTHLPRERVVRYEDVIASGGRALQVVVPGAGMLAEPLRSKNRNELYREEQMRRLAGRLLGTAGAYWEYYSRADVESLVS